MFRDLGTVRLETERLILRRFKETDAEAVFQGFTGDAKCAEFCTWRVHPDSDYTKKILSFWIDEYEDGAYNWVAERKDTHELIGNVNTASISRSHRTCEIGYCFGSRFRGQGYATEALQRVLSFLLDECGFHVIEGRHESSNPASGRVMEKAGMTCEAVLSERRFDPENNVYHDIVVYSIKNQKSLP